MWGAFQAPQRRPCHTPAFCGGRLTTVSAQTHFFVPYTGRSDSCGLIGEPIDRTDRAMAMSGRKGLGTGHDAGHDAGHGHRELEFA